VTAPSTVGHPGAAPPRPGTGSSSAPIVAATVATAATAGLGLAHVLEIPGKHALAAAEVAAVHHHLYGGFAIVGGACEVAALVLLGYVAIRRRTDDSVAPSLWVALTSVAVALGVYGFGLRRLNGRIARWSAGPMPDGWRSTLGRWEALHAVSFVLMSIAFGCCLALL